MDLKRLNFLLGFLRQMNMDSAVPSGLMPVARLPGTKSAGLFSAVPAGPRAASKKQKDTASLLPAPAYCNMSKNESHLAPAFIKNAAGILAY
jgi:hypothetical protein